MFKFLFSLIQITFFFISFCFAQVPNIGLVYSNSNVTDGYILFTPENSNNAYLINNCGEMIREWTFHEMPGATCYLLENGNILRAGKDSLTIKDWDNNLIWSYPTTANGINQNHDIEPLPNGNVLCIVSKNYTRNQIIAEGRDSTILGASFKMEKIVEIQPVSINGGAVVWEWSFFDHFIQDFDSTKNNFGVVEDHPELMDINANTSPLYDWSHSNSVDYNPDLDQILFSSRHLNEIFIIDHSTTTVEAASHSGGNSNHGGDFLWRWGNVKAYRQGTSQNQKLFFQHDAKWVDNGFPDMGKITVFNNNGDSTMTYSSVHIITPEISNGEYVKVNNKFAPLDYEWSWNGTILGHLVQENRKSGIQALSTGNILIAEASHGQVSEISKNGNLIWSYVNPVGSTIYNQYDVITSQDNVLYKAEKYAVDFAGFVGKDLTPIGIIENQNSISDTCIGTLNINDYKFKSLLFQNPIVNNKMIFNREFEVDKYIITDITGKIMVSKSFYRGMIIDVNLPPSIYLLQLISKSEILNLKFIIQK